MAQGKSSASGRSGKSPAGSRTTGGASNRPGGKQAPAATKKVNTSRPTGRGPAQRPPTRRKGKSIVNQKQTPWGLIIAAIAVVVFAAAVVVVVLATRPSDDAPDHTTAGGQAVDKSDPYRQPELPAAEAIKGVTYKVEGSHTHEQGTIKYDSTPPVGGDHSQYWADCTGTVYSDPIANENAVHMLEHGAIWITYNADDIKGSQLDALKKDVSGIDRMALSPYPDLSTPISLQAWGYQLKLTSATDPRIQQFISALKYNQKTTPEYGATCSQPTFKQHPSTFGNPLWTPASGADGNTGGL